LLLLFLMVLISLFATYNISVILPKICGIVLGPCFFYAFLHSARMDKRVVVTLAVFLVIGLGLLGKQWTNNKHPFHTSMDPVRMEAR
jgi:glucose uptake protein GlcU